MTTPPEQHSGGRVVVATSAPPSQPPPAKLTPTPSTLHLASILVGRATRLRPRPDLAARRRRTQARTTDETADGAGETDAGAEEAGAGGYGDAD